jgi:nitroreductase
MAVLAPNSSNTQTWDFYWAHSPDLKKRLAHACLDQSAAKTCSDLVVVAANAKRWRRSIQRLIEFNEKVDAPKSVKFYYKDIVPRVYRHKFFNLHLPLKKLIFAIIGWFRPVPRRPLSKRDVQELCVKSAALAAENFALAITAQGFGTCMMEGFDERRVQKYLNLTRSDRIVMVIAVGSISQDGKWGPRYRLPNEEVIHRL